MIEDPVARWIMGLADGVEPNEKDNRFLQSALAAWPRVLAHSRRELGGQGLNGDEVESLAREVWEQTLRSIWKGWCKRPSFADRIKNLENYMIGAYHHRWNRRMKRKRREDAILEFRSFGELAKIADASNSTQDGVREIDRYIQLQEANRAMDEEDETVRLAISGRLYGRSWRTLSNLLKVDADNLRMRVNYALAKIRRKFKQG